MKKEALLYERLTGDRVRCQLCLRRCEISPGNRGYCRTRINEAGRLFTLTYGLVAAQHVAPTEIKPLFHFYPGSRAFSLGSLGCNFRCIHCQNWEIAHSDLKTIARDTRYLSPEEAVRLAKTYHCQGLSFTYNEPTLWLEYTLDVAKLAKQDGLYTNYVTNGYITPEALDTIGPYLDAFRVDVKGFSQEFYWKLAQVKDFQGILQAAERAKKKWKLHVEVITNVIPGMNDDEAQLRGIARWIATSLGPETPWHVTRFHPHLELAHLPPTPMKTLERGREIGMEEGLQFVYLGNVPGHPGENTYCPRCGQLLIERYHVTVLKYFVENGKCRFCQAPVPIVGEYQDGKID